MAQGVESQLAGLRLAGEDAGEPGEADVFDCITELEQPAEEGDDAAAEEAASDSSPDDMTCAICLERPELTDVALVKGCEHLYCVHCILQWALCREWCPQCKAPFGYLLTHRQLDGAITDYLAEESVVLLKRARWFEAHVREKEAERAALAPPPPAAARALADGTGAAGADGADADADAAAARDWADFYEDYVDAELEEDEEIESYYFSSAAGRARVVLGNRRWGEGGYLRAGRMYARPVQGGGRATPNAAGGKAAAGKAAVAKGVAKAAAGAGAGPAAGAGSSSGSSSRAAPAGAGGSGGAGSSSAAAAATSNRAGRAGGGGSGASGSSSAAAARGRAIPGSSPPSGAAWLAADDDDDDDDGFACSFDDDYGRSGGGGGSRARSGGSRSRARPTAPPAWPSRCARREWAGGGQRAAAAGVVTAARAMLAALARGGAGVLGSGAPGLGGWAAALGRALSSASAAAAAGGVQSLRLPCAEETLLVSLPERPFAATAHLEAGVAAGLAGAPQRVAVVRPAFLPFDEPQPALSEVVAPLGGGAALALAASSQLTHRRLLVDEYARGPGGAYTLTRPATELAAWLHAAGVPLALVPDVGAAARGGGGAPRNAVAGATRDSGLQSTNRVLMVAPTAFGFNEQAAADNSFMHSAETPGEHSSLTAQARPRAQRGQRGGLRGAVRGAAGPLRGEEARRRHAAAPPAQVCAEFAELHRQLTDVAGVDVALFQHHLRHGTPDAVFPNNWFSTHAAGEAAGGVRGRTLVLYPMKCPNRAAERRAEVVGVLRQGGYDRVVDMTAHERRDGTFFEGTGVLVLDRVNGVAYVALSERADAGLAEAWASSLGYRELVTFHSCDARGKPVYHTNVMMAIGTDVAVVCAESVADAKERQHLLAKLSATHEVVQISSAQMDALCGNVLELRGGRGLPVLAMSTQAHNAFTPEQRAVLRRHVADLVHAPIDTLERVGGGGVRCALAELF
ncbi:hypothetical protein HT031_001423 [Scenedesmus sp. PABB004]|nr:hypothetical protein HT031_001423 [Scenedesmus sp. PABB004]